MKSKIFYLGFLFTAVLLASCNKGDTGPQGPTGATGTVNVIVDNYSVPGAAWVNNGTAGQSGANETVDIVDSDLTADLVANATVLAYIQFSSSTDFYFLPFTFNLNSGPSETISVGYNVMDVFLEETLSDNSLPTNSNIIVKVVIIPGSQKKAWPVNLKDYAAVKAYFHLPN